MGKFCVERVRSRTLRLSRMIVIGALAVAGCGGDEPPLTDATETIGAGGGEIEVEGARLAIPPGALPADTEITISLTASPPPDEYEAYSPVFAFAPEGLEFAVPATLALSFDQAAVDPTVFWTEHLGSHFEVIGGAASAGTITVEVTHFSRGFAGNRSKRPCRAESGGIVREGESRTIACGLNGAGSQQQTCDDGAWEDEGGCEDSDVCVNGDTRLVVCGLNDSGAQGQLCADGQWQDDGGCEDSDVCTESDTRVLACGLNGNGSQAQSCQAGQWQDDGGCDDPDVCIDDDTRSVACGLDDNGTQTQICAGGQWQDDGACACGPGFAGADCSDCEAGRFGAGCALECPGGASDPCSGNGICDDGVAGSGTCSCEADFSGDECAQCTGGVEVTYAGTTLPAEIAGHYVEAFDCALEEGGAWFGGVDYQHCFRKADGSAWRIWNTGCGWEYGLVAPDSSGWQRHARTYSGQCSAIPPEQLDTRALTTSVFYDGFGTSFDDLASDYCGTSPTCTAGVEVIYAGTTLPAEIAGHYDEAFDCVLEEGGAWFGGVAYQHCFRKDDGSAWRIWNTGCGWEYGLVDPDSSGWSRHARTYSGQCSAIPPEQLDTRALTTSVFYDGFGTPFYDLDSGYCPASPTCTVGVEVIYAGTTLPAEIAGHYEEAFDCALEEGGAWFGGVDYQHCFRKADGSAWRIWNTGCGWEYGLVDPDSSGWQRHARTYSGQCSAIPPEQLDTRALTTSVFYDGFGTPFYDLDSAYCPAP